MKHFHKGDRVLIVPLAIAASEGNVEANSYAGEIVSIPTTTGAFWVRLNSGRTIVAHEGECKRDDGSYEPDAA